MRQIIAVLCFLMSACVSPAVFDAYVSRADHRLEVVEKQIESEEVRLSKFERDLSALGSTIAELRIGILEMKRGMGSTDSRLEKLEARLASLSATIESLSLGVRRLMRETQER